MKIIFRNGQSPGDGIALHFAITSLHNTHPHKYQTDIRSPYPELFIGNPLITPIKESDADKIINASYETIHKSNQHPYIFLTSFIADLEKILDIGIKPAPYTGFIHIENKEKCWYSVIYEKLQKDVPYWVVNAGYKTDFTAKSWGHDKYQQVVDQNPGVTFVQVGHKNHIHPPLKGKNLINLVGQTDLRQLIRLIYNAFGVITPVSLAMMLSTAVSPHPRFNRKSRACIVLAGGREPNHWQQLPNQQYIHTCGMLNCCDLGGCWKSRIVPLNDGDHKDKSLCLYPIKTQSGQTVSKCMDLITPQEISMLIQRYMRNLEIRL